MTRTIFHRAAVVVILLLTTMLTAVTAQGANLVVRNFKMLPTDQTAINPETMKKDQNGKTAALIKVYTNLNPEQTYFSNGVMGIVAKENKPGQIWLYIPARSQSLEITNQRYSPYHYNFEEEILPGKTYSMDLTIEGKDVTLSASVRGAALYVDGDSVGVSPLTLYLSYGDHAVKAEKGLMLYDNNIHVTPDGPNRFELPMEDESLKYSDVTVKVPGNAEIYYNGERVGVGEWHERLKQGQYSVEIRKVNCENRIETFDVVGGSPTLVNAPAPDPYKGFLSIHVIPTTGTKIYDGDTIVAEHNLHKQLEIGKYTYTFQKSGYDRLTKTFTVERNKETTDTVILQRKQYIRTNALYAGVGFTYGTIPGVSAHIGGVANNFNLEVGYTFGIGKSKEVYWYEESGLYDDACTYSMDEFEVKVGYQFSFVERIGLIPQLGYMNQRIRGGLHYNGEMCHNLSIGAHVVFNPHPAVGVFVTPEYAIPVSKSNMYDRIAQYGGFSKGGFYVSAGVTFNFGI